MNFQYTASGSVKLGGCSNYKLIIFFYYAFGIGSIVFSKPKALKGIYEKIVIKNVRIPEQYHNNTTCRYCTLTALYIDTLNAYWNENELVSYDDAHELIKDYIVRRNALAENAAFKCK